MTDEVPKEQTLSNLVRTHHTHQRQLIHQQRNYRKILSKKLLNRKACIGRRTNLKNNQSLKSEKDDICAQLWVANGTTYVQENEVSLKNIKCLVTCIENLIAENKKLKSQTQIFESQIKRFDKDIYDLQQQAIANSQDQDQAEKECRVNQILENQMLVTIQRKNNFAVLNQRIREDIVRIVNFRSYFNYLYTKMINIFRSDKKYLIDLMEYVQTTCEKNINAYENKPKYDDNTLRKVDMQDMVRKIEDFDFLEKKDQLRELDDIESREYKRRDMFRSAHQRKIKLYNSVLDKILAHSSTQSIDKVIENFQEQESLYDSYFKYANEQNEHITTLNTTLGDLYERIEVLRENNEITLNNQIGTIANLGDTLAAQRKTNQSFEEKKRNCDRVLENIFKEIHEVFVLCRADTTHLENLLGDHSRINAINVKQFLHILEEHLNTIVARVYVMQRKDQKIKPGQYVVSSIEKTSIEPTELDDIVLTQLCPECAAGKLKNEDAAKCVIQSLKDVRKQLQEEVVKPEMQYCLHSLSECRLQQSKILANSKLN